jgi:hypothetical protein
MTTIVRTEVRQRTVLGKIIKWAFILFNLLMLTWMLLACGTVTESMNAADSDAAQAGTAVGGAIASGMLLFVWMAGDVILGLFVLMTRGKRIIVDEAVR